MSVRSVDVLLLRPWALSAVPESSLVEDSLGVGYLASSLRKGGLRVAVADAYTLGLDQEGVARLAIAMRPRVLGISLHSFADFTPAISLASAVKASLPSTHCVLGGEHATFQAQAILSSHSCVDAIVLGEGEITFLELVKHLLGNKDHNAPILGAVIRLADGSLVDGGFRPAIDDLDSLPPPAKDIVETALRFGKKVALSVLTGRGCTHKCTFCTANTFLRSGGGDVWRRRSPERVVDEMQALASRYAGNPLIHPMIQFQDVIFLGTSKSALAWVDRFLGEMESRDFKIPFYAMSRAEAILANANYLGRLSRRGLRSIEIGIESGIERILQGYRKQNSTERTHQALQLLRQHGVCYDASGFIMFDPHITLEELKQNAEYLVRIGHATWDRFITKLQVFPGTAIRPQLIAEGLLDKEIALQDVYSYRFEDPRVGSLAEALRTYPDDLRLLDAVVHQARSTLSNGCIEPAASELERCVQAAQTAYRNAFVELADAAANGCIASKLQAVHGCLSACARVITGSATRILAGPLAIRTVPVTEGQPYFAATQESVVDQILDAADLRRNDVLLDLGSGDGRIIIRAAERFGVVAHGIEIDPELARTARERAADKSVLDRVTVKVGDARFADLSPATIVFLFLEPRTISDLIPLLMTLPRGCRIISNAFELPGFAPTKIVYLGSSRSGKQRAYLYECPLSCTRKDSALRPLSQRRELGVVRRNSPKARVT